MLDLKDLLKDQAANRGRIIQLLEDHKGLAEFEVARFMVSRAMAPAIEEMLHSLDPRERRHAVRQIPITFPSSSAARLLRKMVKDSDNRTASAARKAVGEMDLQDVSLPDSRIKGPWRPQGWNYGLFANRYPVNRRVRHGWQGKSSLPVLKSRADVATLLGLKESELEALMRPGQGSAYVEFTIPKPSGGVRKLSAPRKQLKAAQRIILERMLMPLPAHDCAHGFVPGRSTVTHARLHTGAAVLVKIDLRDFFPSIHFRRVAGFFTSCGYSHVVSSLLAGLTTHRQKLEDGTVVWPGSLPQGAPTSPALANLVCRRLDSRLLALTKKFGGVYSRYADDLSFSFKEAPEKLGRFVWWVNAICQQEGFAENEPKRRVMRQSNQLRVTGLVVNQKVGIAREDRRRFRAILKNCEKHGVASQARGKPNFEGWLAGYAAYAQMVHPELGKEWSKRVEALLKK